MILISDVISIPFLSNEQVGCLIIYVSDTST